MTDQNTTSPRTENPRAPLLDKPVARPVDKPKTRPVDKPARGTKTRQATACPLTTATKPDATGDRRFADPLIMEITELWRQRQGVVRADTKLVLQIKANCRRLTSGDKAEADRLFRAIEKGTDHPLAGVASAASAPFYDARLPLIESRKRLEKHLAKLARDLPIAHVADEIRGINLMSLAAIVGEAGDLSAYPSIAGVWKRAGLAVIGGERQRRKADPILAIEHGFAPQRLAVFWNVGEALFKAQGKDDSAGPYRQVYDTYRAQIQDRCVSDGQAHNRAKRYMLKRLLKNLTLEWKRMARGEQHAPA